MEIASNWSPENGLQIRDIIQESDNLPTGDLVDLLDEEKCISLVRTSHEHCKECTIKFVTKSPWNGNWRESAIDKICKPQKRKCLNGLKILSEARVVEICLGIHEEYHKTVHGTLMGDFGDSKIYMSEVAFDKPQDTVFVKLKATCLDGSVWIYGLHLAVTAEAHQAFGANRTASPFSGDHLSSVLKDKGVHLSKDADKFRQMLEGFNGGGGDCNNRFAGNHPMGIMSMMLGAKNSPCNPLGLSSECEMDVKNGNACAEKEVLGNGKGKLQMSDFLSILENRSTTGKGGEICNSVENEAMYNIQNNEKDLKLNNQSNCENSTNVIMSDEVLINERGNVRDSSQPIADIMDKLQSMSCDDSLITKEINRFGSIIDLLSKSSTASKAVMESSKASSDVLKFGKIQDDNGKMEWKKSNDSEVILNKIGNIVDEKLSAMEERLLKKIEEKFEEKSKEDTLRLERIEELFSKIHDKL